MKIMDTSSSEKRVRIVTHSGTFHADELFAVATLEMYLGDTPHEVIRSRDPEVIATGDYVVDVGDVYDPGTNRFDHHQHGGAGERDGVPYSSFGLVWKHFGEKVTGSKEIAEHLERRLVYPIDLADNGIETYTPVRQDIHPYLFHNIVVAYRPTWKEGQVQDERFAELIPIMRRLLEREIVKAGARIEGAALVRAAYESASDKRLIVLDGPYPWHEELAVHPEPLYVVKPKHQGGMWEVECVRNDVHLFENRKPLPEAWRGFRNGALKERTGVPDAVFCHNSGFIAVAETKEGALRLAELALAA